MAYISEKPRLPTSVEMLRATIPGWGVDKDPADRPAVPKESFHPESTGAHWQFPERQPERYPRERSNEHRFLTPVFGTSCPPKGVSGAIRRYAYTFSEGRLAHWLLLVIADRVEVAGSRVSAVFRGRPDNPITEMGLLAEVRRHGIRSRLGRGRVDVRHLPIDVALLLGTKVVGAAALALLGARLFRARKRDRGFARVLRALAP